MAEGESAEGGVEGVGAFRENPYQSVVLFFWKLPQDACDGGHELLVSLLPLRFDKL